VILRCSNGSAGAHREARGLSAPALRGERGALIAGLPDEGLVEPFLPYAIGESNPAMAKTTPQVK
jgi:hypothetical protein